MRARLSGFVLASLALASPALFAGDRPPQDLHQVGDHWTAWNPPTPPEGAQVHVIQAGDTLWNLAAKLYQDPYLWPQLWENNRYILDAHWIYPGDPLVLGPTVAAPEQLAGEAEGDLGPAEEGPAEAPIEGVQTSAEAAGAPVPLGYESDVYCSGYIDDADKQFSVRIIGSEFETLGPNLDQKQADVPITGSYGRVNTARYNLTVGDVIYLNQGRQNGLSAGQVFTVISPRQKVVHPKTREVFGRYYHYTGRVRILSVQEDTAIAEILQACDPVIVGEYLQPFEPEPVPLGRPTAMRPINYPTAVENLQQAPIILFSQDELVSLFEDHLVFIDRGAEDDVTPGDIYTVYRMNRPGLPPMPIGEVAVLSVHKKSSAAKIIESKTAIFVGDPLELK
jgi:LysM repeat protein